MYWDRPTSSWRTGDALCPTVSFDSILFVLCSLILFCFPWRIVWSLFLDERFIRRHKTVEHSRRRQTQRTAPTALPTLWPTPVGQCVGLCCRLPSLPSLLSLSSLTSSLAHYRHPMFALFLVLSFFISFHLLSSFNACRLLVCFIGISFH